MDEAFKKAVRPGQPIDLSLVPTHAEVKATLNADSVLGGLLAKAGMESHHTFPKYVQKLLGITDPTIQDTTPSLVLRIADHQNSPGSFHSIINELIPKRSLPGQFSRQELLDRLEQAYVGFGKPEVFQAAKAWLLYVESLQAVVLP